MQKVFISHSWEDNEISRRLAEYLKRDGADIWIDYTRIHGGDSLPRRISEALEWCDTLILLWSKSAKDSYYVNLEWENALDLRKVIIPCLLDETKRPAILSRCLFIHFKNFDEGYRHLVYALDLEIQQEFIKKVTPPPISVNFKHRADPKISSLLSQKAKLSTILFRSEPQTLSSDDVESMLKKFDFFDSSRNKTGRGFANQYKAETIKGDNVVFDEVTGLMWQQGGSPNYMQQFESAKKWVADLNKKGFAGFHDWRLPTIEEAMSLMEPEKLQGDFYIDPIFDVKQSWIWTSDLYYKPSSAWVVRFGNGMCYFDPGYYSIYVRAVRSAQADNSD